MKEPYFSRLSSLRRAMEAAGIDAYLVLTDDYHASEYVSPYFRSRAFFSSFDGSAGTLLITGNSAFLWTDGRYFLQAEEQLAGTGIALMKAGEPGVPSLSEYLKSSLTPGQTLGYDGRTVNARMGEDLKSALKGVLFSETLDLVAPLWKDRPPFPHAPIWHLDESFSGKSTGEKLTQLRASMESYAADCHLLASLDDIAWLYNYRGSDVANNPVAMAYSLVFRDKAILYIALDAVSPSERARFEKDGISLRPYLQVYEDLRGLFGSVLLDKRKVNCALLASLPGAVKVLDSPNPTALMKAKKNPVEAENERSAHLKDGISMTKVICWLKKMQSGEDFRSGKITELTVARKLHEIRKSMPDFLDESFPSIIASGAHGAIVHYDPTEESDIPLQNNSFLLMDTGCHFLQGSTDITRTVSLGTVSQEMKEHYTAVLRGHLDLGMATFKAGQSGANLDILARGPLWESGLDYRHGTGHGVGYLLNVHEGPQNISPRGSAALEEGMLTSDEPGLYLEGKYGIRIENLTLTRKAAESEYGTFLSFEHLTLVPYDREAILPELLNEKEKRFLNAYQERVYAALAPYLSPEEALWLKDETAPL